MIKKIIVLLLTVFTLGASAQTEKGLLWKISGNGLAKPSYLYGTIHLTCDATLDQNILDAMKATSQLYLELDMDDPGMQAKMMQHMAMKDGQTMAQLASPEDYKIVDSFFKNTMGLPLAMMNNYKPSLVSMMLYTKMMDCPPQSYEQNLMKVAQQQNEEIYGLETVDEQMAVFDSIPYSEQMAELVKTAKDSMREDKARFYKMMEVYKTKDLNAIMKLMNEDDDKVYGEHSDVLLADRNKKWISKIESVAKGTPTFFAVGAAHLGGDQGVINLLRKQGYTVEAVK